jgi:hypothetical protein
MFKRSTVLLVLVAFALIAGVWALDLFQTQQEQQAAEESRLLSVEASSVQEIEILSKASPASEEAAAEPQSIQVSRVSEAAGETGWQITEPITAEADDFAISNLLGKVTTLEPQTEIAASADLSQYGLDPAQSTLILTLEDGAQQRLNLGREDFDQTGIYLQVGERVVTVPRSDQQVLTPDLFTLRSKTLAQVERSAIADVVIQGPESTIKLVQTANGWQIQEPQDLPVDESSLDGLINPLLSLQASSFVAESKSEADLEEFGLRQPTSVVTVTLEPNAEAGLTNIVLNLGAQTQTDPPQVYVTTSQSPTIATIPMATAEALQPTLLDLRNKSLGRIEPEALAEVAVNAQDQDLERTFLPSAVAADSSPNPSSNRWEVSDQPGRMVSLEGLFTALQEIRATDFLSSADIDATGALESPTLTMTLVPDSESDERLLVELGEDAGRAYARSSQQPEILVIDSSAIAELVAILETFKPLPEPVATPSP